jgi:predicted GIY-YIG superfamily endonuclease
MSSETGEQWSEWLDFNQDIAKSVSETPGVFVMHTAMKILFIGSTQNLRRSLLESLTAPCLEKAKRFRYMIKNSQEKVKEQLIQDYIKKHNGKLPECMEIK